MELHNPEKSAANTAKVLEWFRQDNKDHIFHIQHIAGDPALASFFQIQRELRLMKLFCQKRMKALLQNISLTAF